MEKIEQTYKITETLGIIFLISILSILCWSFIVKPVLISMLKKIQKAMVKDIVITGPITKYESKTKVKCGTCMSEDIVILANYKSQTHSEHGVLKCKECGFTSGKLEIERYDTQCETK